MTQPVIVHINWFHIYSSHICVCNIIKLRSFGAVGGLLIYSQQLVCCLPVDIPVCVSLVSVIVLSDINVL